MSSPQLNSDSDFINFMKIRGAIAPDRFTKAYRDYSKISEDSLKYQNSYGGETKKDINVDNPPHYEGFTRGIDAKTAMRSMLGKDAMIDYWWGCAFKYLWRWHLKNGIQDLRKCQKCIDFLIEEYTHEADSQTE